MGPGLSPDNDETLISMLAPGLEDEGEALHPACHIAGDAIWSVPAYQDDIEHLQNMAFIMVWELGKSWGVKMKSCQTAPVVCRRAIALRVTAAAHRPPSFCPLRGVVRHSVRQPGWMLC